MGQVEKIPVIRIEMAGPTTSFRYRLMMQGYQPTYEMPPPSTIYGHICSAVGDWVDIGEHLQFGYHFVHDGKFVDYKEHLHFKDPVQPFPFDRELLFRPKLTLYITQIDLIDAFRHPYYPVVLGRSQDLMTYLSVEMIELERAERAYFEYTILPDEMAPKIGKGSIVQSLPRYIDQRRHPTMDTYALLQHRAIWPPTAAATVADGYDDDEEDGSGFIYEDDKEIDVWIDPDSPTHYKEPTLKRAVWLHRFDQ